MQNYGTLQNIGAKPGDHVSNSVSDNHYVVLTGHRLKSMDTNRVYEWEQFWNASGHDVWTILNTQEPSKWQTWDHGNPPVTDGEVEVLWANGDKEIRDASEIREFWANVSEDYREWIVAYRVIS